MIKIFIALGGLALLSSTLVGCAGAVSGQFNPTASSNIQTVLNVACPMLSAVQSSGLKLTTTQTTAVAALAAACPPNPPPTSALGAAEDLIAAYTTLQPLLK